MLFICIFESERCEMGLEFLNKYVFGVGIPVLLLLTGIFYCIRLRFFYFLHPIKVIKSLHSKEKEKGVSSAKALTHSSFILPL